MKKNSLYYGDCLEVMKQFPDGSVDLIYLDPPFNSNANYNILFKNQRPTNGNDDDFAQITAFTDTWFWSPEAQERVDNIKRAVAHPAHKSITALDLFLENGTGMLSYLSYMAERLAETRRLLKDTGSIYLHCDPTASHYLKIIMDDIFGKENYRNEIVWKRKQDTHNLAKRQCGKAHDIIFWYAMSKTTKYNRQFSDYTDEYIRTAYKHKDKNGTYRTLPCTNETGGNKVYTFRGITRAWRFSETRMQEMFDDDLLVQSTPTSPFQYKKYLDSAEGVPVDDMWLDIDAVRGKKESLNYPTQKPLALLERIIRASSNEGDFVLDPFCGCGTTIEAAYKLKREWIGIDVSFNALDVVRNLRMKNQKIPVQGEPMDMSAAADMAHNKPFDFEKWAVTRIPGFWPNDAQVADGGIDGRAMIYQVGKDQNSLCIAQVKGGKTSPDSLTAFTSRIMGGRCAMGVFITLNTINTPTVRQCIANAGKIKIGAEEYNRMVMWSIEEYFAGVKARLPAMANPRTGKAYQAELSADQSTQKLLS